METEAYRSQINCQNHTTCKCQSQNLNTSSRTSTKTQMKEGGSPVYLRLRQGKVEMRSKRRQRQGHEGPMAFSGVLILLEVQWEAVEASE